MAFEVREREGSRELGGLMSRVSVGAKPWTRDLVIVFCCTLPSLLLVALAPVQYHEVVEPNSQPGSDTLC